MLFACLASSILYFVNIGVVQALQPSLIRQLMSSRSSLGWRDAGGSYDSDAYEEPQPPNWETGHSSRS